MLLFNQSLAYNGMGSGQSCENFLFNFVRVSGKINTRTHAQMIGLSYLVI